MNIFFVFIVAAIVSIILAVCLNAYLIRRHEKIMKNYREYLEEKYNNKNQR